MSQGRSPKSMELVSIKQTLDENREFLDHPDCKETLHMSIGFYKRIGYHPPWIGYYAKIDDRFVGSCGFKGAPKNGKVEIAYGTFPNHRRKGYAAEMCRQLIRLARQEDPAVMVTARTLPHENYSTKILQKNNFQLVGTVRDDEDGDVWEWQYINDSSTSKS